MILPIDFNIFPERKGVFVVGGSIRDLLCSRVPLDYDIIVKGDAASFAKRLASSTHGRLVEFGPQAQTIRRVIAPNIIFDIMPIQGQSIEDDLRRRDFTVNAMAVTVSSGDLVDPHGGRRDLAAKKIRMVSGDVFREDPLRLIRAFRLAASFDFSIETGTHEIIGRQARLIGQTAAERIRDEFFKLLQCDRSHVYLHRMAQSGLLFEIFPELSALKMFRSPDASSNDLFEQTLSCLKQFENMLSEGNLSMGLPGSPVDRDVDVTCAVLVKWSILFHNIGKPSVRMTPGGRIRFGKDQESENTASVCARESAAMARKTCQRLRFSGRQTDRIDMIIAGHLQPFVLFQAREDNELNEAAFIRFFMEFGTLTPVVLLHSLAGCKGRKSPSNPKALQAFTGFVRSLLKCYYRDLRPRASRPALLNGDDLITEFGLKPSARFKRILTQVAEAHLANRIRTREQALALVGNLLDPPARLS